MQVYDDDYDDQYDDMGLNADALSSRNTDFEAIRK
jgi:hypothetical protein